MNIIEISAAQGCAPTLALGRRGENLATEVRFDFSAWAEEFGEGRVEIYARRCGDENAYPVYVTVEGQTAVWAPTATDTHVVGYGTAEFVWVAGETVVKSAVFGTFVEPDIGQPTDTPPDPYESWLDTLTELAADTEAAAQRAETAEEASETARTAAEAAQASAAQSAAEADYHDQNAMSHANAAGSSANAANAAKAAAQTSEANASASATAAANSATAAAASETAAEAAQTAAEAAQAAAEAVLASIPEDYSTLSDTVETIDAIVAVSGVTATGVAARINSAVAESATCETEAATVIRYRTNLRTRETAPTNVHLATDEDGAWVLSGTIGANSYYIDLQTGIKLKAGVTYRVDGSPRTRDSAGLCLYVGGTRYAYDSSHNGATYTPQTDVSADLKLRVMANATYNNEKFYPIVCENTTAARSAPDMLELLEGKNEVVGLDFLPLTVTYDQDKLQILDAKIDNIVSRDFTIDDIAQFEDADGYISSSFTVMMRQPFWTNGRIVGILSQHIAGETKANLRVQLCDSSGAARYTSRRYDIGGTIEPIMQEFKCPPAAKTNVLSYDHVRVSVTVPEGTKLKVSNFYSFEAGQARHNDDCGIRWHAHAGFPGLCPSNSIPGFQYAGKLGFTSCITIPKFTSDGIGVCFHDDGSISGDLVWMDGSEITGDDDIGIANYSYEYITQNFRLRTSWGTLHVPTIDDFFRICSMCNMAPIFSVHSTGFGSTYAAGFAYIRELAVKWNVLNKLWIKSGSASVQSAAFEAFGTDMAGMILIRGQSSTWDPLEQAKLIVNNNGDHVLATTATSAKEAVMPLVFELFHAAATDEAIALGISEGFKVSIATTDAALTGPVMMAYIGKGVTEFTDDYHCSLGLDWTCR